MGQAIFNVTLGDAFKTVPKMAMKRETDSFFEKWRFN
jgi:septation ring formation regulator EzrA